MLKKDTALLDWTAAIDRNRQGLLRLLAALFVMAGGGEGKAIQKLPRFMRWRVLRLLRPAEAAGRRLFMMVLKDLKVKAAAARAAKPFPKVIPKGKDGAMKRAPSFSLHDPKQLVGVVRRKYAPANGPRITLIGYDEDPVFVAPKPKPMPDDLVDGERLARRMLALQLALKNVKKHARRLGRWRAKHPERIVPFRLRRPPGYKPEHVHEVYEILSDCHVLAKEALKPPDTS